MNVRFGRRELRDLAVAWLALGLAFTLFIERSLLEAITRDPTTIQLGSLGMVFGLSLGTVGVGFLLHELAHKVVAVRFGQVAAFRADYSMLLLAILSGILGFLFAAPGAVYHRGQITTRENGLISAAGPITNLALAGVFVAIGVLGARQGITFMTSLGSFGVTINLLLAGFNMIPWGPLDGRKVLDWHPVAYLTLAVPSIGLAALVFLGGIGSPL